MQNTNLNIFIKKHYSFSDLDSAESNINYLINTYIPLIIDEISNINKVNIIFHNQYMIHDKQYLKLHNIIKFYIDNKISNIKLYDIKYIGMLQYDKDECYDYEWMYNYYYSKFSGNIKNNVIENMVYSKLKVDMVILFSTIIDNKLQKYINKLEKKQILIYKI